MVRLPSVLWNVMSRCILFDLFVHVYTMHTTRHTYGYILYNIYTHKFNEYDFIFVDPFNVYKYPYNNNVRVYIT